MLRAGSQVSWYEWILPISSWGLHNSYINLSIFSIIFCHISMTACHMMSKMMIWAIGPMAYVPTKFHWDILKNEGILTTTTTTTTSKIIIIIIIIAKMKPHKNKIPFPFWGNGITRGTVQGHRWIPFPSFRYGKKTGNNENLRRKWILCKSSHVSNYK